MRPGTRADAPDNSSNGLRIIVARGLTGKQAGLRGRSCRQPQGGCARPLHRRDLDAPSAAPPAVQAGAAAVGQRSSGPAAAANSSSSGVHLSRGTCMTGLARQSGAPGALGGRCNGWPHRQELGQEAAHLTWRIPHDKQRIGAPDGRGHAELTWQAGRNLWPFNVSKVNARSKTRQRFGYCPQACCGAVPANQPSPICF